MTEVVRREQLAAGARTEVTLGGPVLKNPHLWEPDYPYLYRVVCTLRVNGAIVDTWEINGEQRYQKHGQEHGFGDG